MHGSQRECDDYLSPLMSLTALHNDCRLFLRGHPLQFLPTGDNNLRSESVPGCHSENGKVPLVHEWRFLTLQWNALCQSNIEISGKQEDNAGARGYQRCKWRFTTSKGRLIDAIDRRETTSISVDTASRSAASRDLTRVARIASPPLPRTMILPARDLSDVGNGGGLSDKWVEDNGIGEELGV